MVTVGSLAYSIVANTQNFTAGVAATRQELKTLKDAFLASQTPVEMYSGAIAKLEDLAQKFPQKAEGLQRTIRQMRAEMAGGGAAIAHASGELDAFAEKIDRRLARLTLSEVMGQLRAIPGLTIAIDAAFGNWLGVAVGALSAANELIKEQGEALEKTAAAYESAEEGLTKFLEAEDNARKKGQAKDRPTGLPTQAANQARELGLGTMGYSASNSWFGMAERLWLRVQDVVTRIEFGSSIMAETLEKAEKIGVDIARDRMESKGLAENGPGKDIRDAQAMQAEFDKFLEIRRRAAEADYAIEQQAAADAAKIKIDAANRAMEIEGRQYEKNERDAESVANKYATAGERLQQEFQRLQELNQGGFFDTRPGAYARALQDIADRANGLGGGGEFKGFTNALHAGTAAAVGAQFGARDTPQKQLQKQQEQLQAQKDGNVILNDIKKIVANNPGLGVVP